MNLIDIHGIAQLLAVTRKYAADRVVNRPSFPPPAVQLSRKTRRWDRAAVQRWIARAR